MEVFVIVRLEYVVFNFAFCLHDFPLIFFAQRNVVNVTLSTGHMFANFVHFLFFHSRFLHLRSLIQKHVAR